MEGPVTAIAKNLFGESLGDPSSIRKRMAELESAMLKMPQAPIRLRHYFANSIYAREVTIPQGTLLIGHVHKYEHLSIMSLGTKWVFTEQGGVVILKAPFTTVSPPGTKRIGYAHTDCVWTTVHRNPTNETDIEKLENDLIARTFLDVEFLPDDFFKPGVLT